MEKKAAVSTLALDWPDGQERSIPSFTLGAVLCSLALQGAHVHRLLKEKQAQRESES